MFAGSVLNLTQESSSSSSISSSYVVGILVSVILILLVVSDYSLHKMYRRGLLTIYKSLISKNLSIKVSCSTVSII